MKLRSIQIAMPRTVVIGDRRVETGIFKTPVVEADITVDGLVGDSIVNTKHHGGPDQAVYVYDQQDYAWWETELDRELPPGTFGENLTFSTFGVGEVMIGDRWEMGEVVLETTSPRIPCATFGAKMGDPGFPGRFREARRPGFYARVLAPGRVSAGLDVARTRSPHALSVLELADLAFDTGAATERLQLALVAPVAERARVDLERRLARST